MFGVQANGTSGQRSEQFTRAVFIRRLRAPEGR